MMESNDLIISEGGRGISPTVIVAELDLKNTRFQRLDNRPYLAAQQTARRQRFQ